MVYWNLEFELHKCVKKTLLSSLGSSYVALGTCERYSSTSSLLFLQLRGWCLSLQRLVQCNRVTFKPHSSWVLHAKITYRFKFDIYICIDILCQVERINSNREKNRAEVFVCFYCFVSNLHYFSFRHFKSL